MTVPAPSQLPPTAADSLKRRANDVASAGADALPAELDAERLYEELRAGKRSIESLAALLPLNLAFLWHAQRRLSEAEFSTLLSGMEIQEVEIGDLPAKKASEPDAAEQRNEAVIAAFNARMAGFELVTAQDMISELELKTVLQAKTPLVDGIGIRMQFAKGPEGEPAKPGTPPGLTLLCRAYIGSTSTQSAVKCEAVISAPGLEQSLYCRIVVPLPIHKGGRRRLLVTILDTETRQPINLPAAVAEIFHENHLFDLRLLRKAGAGTGGLGSAVKDAFGKLFHRS